MPNLIKHYKKALLLALPLALSACGGSDNNNDTPVDTPDPVPTPVSVSYEVTVKNLTNAQPLSPLAVVLHAEDKLWAVGESASVELERVAEGGEAEDFAALGMAGIAGENPIMPGNSDTVSVTIDDVTDAKLTIVTMLVNTNDAFAGLNALDLSELEVGDSKVINSRAYDSGTEANTEGAGTMPGPVDSGEGFNAEREDTNVISMHPGVVGQDDGLASSILSSEHKFDNPVARIWVTRTE